MLDEGSRFHITSHLILEIVNYGKSILATSILGRDDSFEVTNNTKDAGFILSLIQRDRVLSSVFFQFTFLIHANILLGDLGIHSDLKVICKEICSFVM